MCIRIIKNTIPITIQAQMIVIIVFKNLLLAYLIAPYIIRIIPATIEIKGI